MSTNRKSIREPETSDSDANTNMTAPANDASSIEPPAKRRRQSKPKELKKPSSPQPSKNGSTTVTPSSRGVIGVTRSISACQRCRSRKTRCDQKFPSCTACLKAGVECVGIDAATGREIPRSYVSHLEDRVAMLESKLQASGIEYDDKEKKDKETAVSKNPKKQEAATATPGGATAAPASRVGDLMASVKLVNDRPPKQKLGTFLGQSSGLSFARILFTAIKQQRNHSQSAKSTSSVGSTEKDKKDGTGSTKAPEPEKPKVRPARLPTKEVAESLLSAYFSQANAQMPVLHREEFLRQYFEPIYGKLSTAVSLASDYTTVGVERSDEKDIDSYYYKHCYNVPEPDSARADDTTLGNPNPSLFFLNMVFGIATSIHQQQYPAHISESYRLAAAHHFDAVFSSSNRLESLQGLLLMSLYSIMRPATPGVWYVLGSAMRLCVDLGLHYEGGLKSWSNHHHNGGINGDHVHGAEFDPTTIDMRRRLFWCCFALDRQVCVYLGRPFGIPDESVKVPFPSELDDTLISREAQLRNNISDFSKETSTSPSYKAVALSMFKMRQLQSEIQRVLYDCAELPRRFKTLEEWKYSMARKLEDWHDACPKSNRKMNCNFNLAFFELNYHQTRLLLYGLSPGNTIPTVESYLIIADAGEKVIKKYHELHRKRNINYTWVAVHNLFMAGTSYLYALYHSPEVRAGTSLGEIDFNTLACIHVLSSMTDRCDAAASCRDSFELLTAAIMKLCYNEKAGIVMNYSNPPASAQAALPTDPIERPLSVASRALDDSLPSPIVKSEHRITTDLLEGMEPPALETSNQAWPMPDDLELFFQEAAQIEGISPDSIRTGGQATSQSPEAWYSNTSKPGSDYEGGEAMVIADDQRSNMQRYNGASLRPQNNDQQRIYDLMNELPLAPIWDQFFAPGPSTPGGTTAGNANPDLGRWQA